MLIVVLLPAPYFACAQSDVSKKGRMTGIIVEHPERLTGLWEAQEGPDSVVGLDIKLITKIPGAVTSLTGVEQHEEQIYFGVYQRHGAELKFGDENYLHDPRNDTQWNGNHLVYHYVPRTTDELAFDIDLTFEEKEDTWTGLFHRGSFSEYVTLRRPIPGPNVKVSPLVGTWASSDLSDSGRCLHIVEQSDGAFAEWQDMLDMPGRGCYANGLMPPGQSDEYYGDRVKVLQKADHTYSIEFNAYSAGCCSHTFTGTMSADNKTLKTVWQPDSIPLSNSSTWRKIQGDSCRVLPNYQPQTALPRCPPGTVVQR